MFGESDFSKGAKLEYMIPIRETIVLGARLYIINYLNSSFFKIDASSLALGESHPAKEGLVAVLVENHRHRLLEVSDCRTQVRITGFDKVKPANQKKI